jgi:hypothetical protein
MSGDHSITDGAALSRNTKTDNEAQRHKAAQAATKSPWSAATGRRFSTTRHFRQIRPRWSKPLVRVSIRRWMLDVGCSRLPPSTLPFQRFRFPVSGFSFCIASSGLQHLASYISGRLRKGLVPLKNIRNPIAIPKTNTSTHSPPMIQGADLALLRMIFPRLIPCCTL